MKRRAFLKGGAMVAAAVPTSALPINLFPKEINQPKIRVGIIGCGVRGSYLLKLLQENITDAVISAYCDIYEPNLQKAKLLAPAGAAAYKDYRAVTEHKGIDAVIIATPLHLHFPMAMEAVNAGKHVYCEKTMCHNIQQSAELFHKVSNAGTVFQVGYQQRSNLLFQKIYDLVNDGWCGEVTHIDCAWNRNGDWRRRVPDPAYERLINWRMYRAYSGGLTAELCSHQIDIANYLTKSHPQKVVGIGGIDYWKDGRETFDNVNVIFEYPGGMKARFSALTTNAHEGFYIKIYGTKATIEVNRREGQQGFIYPERPPENHMNFQVDGVTGATQEAWDRQEGIPIRVAGSTDDTAATVEALKEFVGCIQKGERPKADVHSGYLSSISTHMANAAMYAESPEHWKEEYNIF
ncbi:MAG TPA: Gfo/Idh/MocA family oxidoreductase [Cyclobacteriaceae bacterium]|nr:Gfo/Idh/MocA family oxidoreductase [Cyclobacteriaceae bacterium]